MSKLKERKLSTKINEDIELPLRLTKLCLSNVRHDNTFISPISIEAAFSALSYSKDYDRFKQIYSFNYYNYFLLDKTITKSLHNDLNKNTVTNFQTEFQIHRLNDIEEKRLIANKILKHFSEKSFQISQKLFGDIIVEPMTLLSYSSLIFRPYKTERWQQISSLKFHSNSQLSVETDFYFTKDFFQIAFHNTFHKIQIPGQTNNGIQMKLIILLPRCSFDLVHIYANMKEYLNLPYTTAYIGVCLPRIFMDIDINLNDSLILFNGLYNLNDLGEFDKQIHLSSIHGLGHFHIDMNTHKTEEFSSKCLHTVDLSPINPWIFFINRPFLFIVMYGDYYLLIGQMLSPKIH